MVKFLSLALAAIATLFTTGAAVSNTSSPCVPFSFVDKPNDATTINSLVDLGVNSGLIKGKLASLEPFTVQTKRLNAVPF